MKREMRELHCTKVNNRYTDGMHVSIFSTQGLEFFPELFLFQQNVRPFGNLVLRLSAMHAFGNVAQLLDRSDSNSEIWLSHLGQPATQSVFTPS